MDELLTKGSERGTIQIVTWGIVLLVPIAAVVGSFVRLLGERVAEAVGHSQRDADRALATAGFSLIVKSAAPIDDDRSMASHATSRG